MQIEAERTLKKTSECLRIFSEESNENNYGSDGAEHVTGNILIGVCVPPYTSLGVIWEGYAK